MSATPAVAPVAARARHPWRFVRLGGFDQVLLDRPEDIVQLHTLDQKLWAALACPVKGLDFDERTLALIDTDNDGRVRSSEVLAAIAFCQQRLKGLGTLIPSGKPMPLAVINDATPAGKHLLACTRRVLLAAGKATADVVTVDDVNTAQGAFTQAPLNGDGVVLPTSTDDPALRQALTDIVACTGGVKDRNGQSGVNSAALADFVTQAGACDQWWKQFESNTATIAPLGEAGTAAAAAAVDAVRAKIDDYFARCRMAAYDQRAQAALNRREEDYLTLASRDLTITADEIRVFPLARIEAGKPLALTGAVNPAWAALLGTLHSAAVQPLLGTGTNTLSEDQWQALQGKLAPWRAWLAARPAGNAHTLGSARLRQLLHADVQGAVAKLIADDAALEGEFNALADVEKLVRLHRDLYRLLNNFVNFTDLYSPDRLAMFQAGHLYLDARACELVVRVDDAAKHAALAGLSKTYLAYCDCTRVGGAKMTIAAAFTAGDSDQLMAGRNGIFYDRKGQDWDATITKVIENPISIRQAFWSPYKKAIRFVEEMVAKRAAAADDAANTKLAAGITATAEAAATGKPKEKPKLDIGIVAALGVAVGGITAALGALLESFFGLGYWMPLGVIALVLAISGPSMVIAALKLRQRNLGPILDANGWAVNGRVKINIPFGGQLTEVAVLPPGSSRSLRDPYAEKKRPWKTIIVLVVLLIGAGWVGLNRLRTGLWFWEERAAAVTIEVTNTSGGADAKPTEVKPADGTKPADAKPVETAPAPKP